MRGSIGQLLVAQNVIDAGALADALVALSRFAEAHPGAASVEVNPFMALPQGGYGVDAVILRH